MQYGGTKADLFPDLKSPLAQRFGFFIFATFAV